MGNYFDEHPRFFHLLFASVTDLPGLFQVYHRELGSRGVTRVVDFGCGTGLFAPYFIDAGYAYVGIDKAGGMLAVARQHEPRATFLCGDIREKANPALSALAPFDAVVCMGRTLGHMFTNEDVAACLANAFERVRPGGTFACDVNDAEVIFNPFHESSASTIPVEGGVLKRESTAKPLKTCGWNYHIDVHATVEVGGRETERVYYESDFRAFTRGELQGFLARAGFTEQFSCSPPGRQTLFAAASKR